VACVVAISFPISILLWSRELPLSDERGSRLHCTQRPCATAMALPRFFRFVLPLPEPAPPRAPSRSRGPLSARRPGVPFERKLDDQERRPLTHASTQPGPARPGWRRSTSGEGEGGSVRPRLVPGHAATKENLSARHLIGGPSFPTRHALCGPITETHRVNFRDSSRSCPNICFRGGRSCPCRRSPSR
jgi:hypothetical protein